MIRNESQHYAVLKKKKQCQWEVHARIENSSKFFYIKEFVKDHTCGSAALSSKNSRLTSSVIAKLIAEDLRSMPMKRPIDVVGEMHQHYEVNVP